MYEDGFICIENYKWENRIKNDYTSFYKENKFYDDKLGINGTKLFPLSFDFINSVNYLREVELYSEEEVKKDIFLALCPELESFISLNLWFNGNDNKQANIALFQKLEAYKKESLKNKILKLEGNYRITKKCLGKVLRFKGELVFEDRNLNFYDWKRVSFLKNSGENFLYIKSPLFLANEHSSIDNILEENVFYFTMLFKKVDRLNKNKIKLEILNITNKYSRLFDFNILSNKFIDDNDLRMGLFKEIIVKKKNKYLREFELVDYTDELSGEELLSHYLNMKLYYNFLLKGTLFLCFKEDFDLFVNKEVRYIKYVLKKSINISPFFFEEYLKNFKFIDKKVYYVPYFMEKYNDEDFISFFNYLNNEKENKIDNDNIINYLKFIKNSEKYGDLKEQFLFYKKYIFFQKRSLIDEIKKSEQKWII